MRVAFLVALPVLCVAVLFVEAMALSRKQSAPYWLRARMAPAVRALMPQMGWCRECGQPWRGEDGDAEVVRYVSPDGFNKGYFVVCKACYRRLRAAKNLASMRRHVHWLWTSWKAEEDRAHPLPETEAELQAALDRHWFGQTTVRAAR